MGDIPVISIIGYSNSGKTQLIEGIIPKLKERGYKIAVAKHSAHGFCIDTPKKDTWRYAQAQADIVLISSAKKWAVINNTKQELSLKDIQKLADGTDIILTEGYSNKGAPKIGVLPVGISQNQFNRQDLIALIGDEIINNNHNIPYFSRDNFIAISDFIEQKFLTQTKKGGGGKQ